MIDHFNEATRNRPEGDRPLDAAAIVIDLPSYVQQIKDEDAWQKNDRNAITVFKSEMIRHVVVALHPEAVLQKPAAEGVMTIQILLGRLQAQAGDLATTISSGQIITVAEKTPYHFKALEETSFLLTMGNPF